MSDCIKANVSAKAMFMLHFDSSFRKWGKHMALDEKTLNSRLWKLLARLT